MATTFNGKEISFDPHDWKGIAELCKRHKEFPTPWAGKNEDGENISISVNKDNITLVTYQSNKWIRTNVYYPEDCSTEELFSH